jgi:hypothetical protein
MLSVSCVNNHETETMNGYTMQQCVLRRMIKQKDIKELKPAHSKVKNTKNRKYRLRSQYHGTFFIRIWKGPGQEPLVYEFLETIYSLRPQYTPMRNTGQDIREQTRYI